MIELKTCPFCGGEAITYKSEIVVPGYTVLCKKCDATVNYYSTNEEAVEAWNRRADGIIDVQPIRHGEWELHGNDDDLDSTYYCSQCHFQLAEDLFYKGYEGNSWVENNVFNYCPNCGADMRGSRL